MLLFTLNCNEVIQWESNITLYYLKLKNEL